MKQLTSSFKYLPSAKSAPHLSDATPTMATASAAAASAVPRVMRTGTSPDAMVSFQAYRARHQARTRRSPKNPNRRRARSEVPSAVVCRVMHTRGRTANHGTRRRRTESHSFRLQHPSPLPQPTLRTPTDQDSSSFTFEISSLVLPKQNALKIVQSNQALAYRRALPAFAAAPLSSPARRRLPASTSPRTAPSRGL